MYFSPRPLLHRMVLEHCRGGISRRSGLHARRLCCATSLDTRHSMCATTAVGISPKTAVPFRTLLTHLIAVYPGDVDEIVLVGHSMGGLIVRSAAHYGATRSRCLERKADVCLLYWCADVGCASGTSGRPAWRSACRPSIGWARRFRPRSSKRVAPASRICATATRSMRSGREKTGRSAGEPSPALAIGRWRRLLFHRCHSHRESESSGRPTARRSAGAPAQRHGPGRSAGPASQISCRAQAQRHQPFSPGKSPASLCDGEAIA